MSSFTIVILALALFAAGCSTSTPKPAANQYKANDPNRPMVDPEYKLSADRQKFDEMRKEVPADKKAENDEIAFILKILNDEQYDRSPDNLREQFTEALRKKREKIQKDFETEREAFTTKERNAREVFLSNAKEAREEFNKTKHTSDEREKFYDAQDEKRRGYFETLKERRSDMDADIQERRRNFDEYIRDMQSNFNQEWRNYSKRYQEEEKLKEAAKAKREEDRQKKLDEIREHADVKAAAAAAPKPVAPDLHDFDSIPKKPGTNLESGE